MSAQAKPKKPPILAGVHERRLLDWIRSRGDMWAVRRLTITVTPGPGDEDLNEDLSGSVVVDNLYGLRSPDLMTGFEEWEP